MKSIIAAILFSSLVACVPRNPTKFAVFIDPNLGSETHQIIHESLLDWKGKTNKLTFTEVIRIPSKEEMNDYDTFFITGKPFDQIKSLCGRMIAQACNKRWPNKSNGSILLPFYSELARHSFVAALHYPGIVRHEIGHAFGLPHNDVKGTVMFEDVAYMSNQVTVIDVYNYLKSRNRE
jgi:hypothetical protein